MQLKIAIKQQTNEVAIASISGKNPPTVSRPRLCGKMIGREGSDRTKLRAALGVLETNAAAHARGRVSGH